MAIPVWSVANNTTLDTITEISPYDRPLPLNITGLTTRIIGGLLPPGLSLQNNSIVGTPLEVHSEKLFTFVVRAQSLDIISDRTFTIRVIKLEIWTVNDNTVLDTITSRAPYSLPLPLSLPDSTTTQLLTPLPVGLALVNNVITGSPLEVDHPYTFNFSIRADNNGIQADRNLSFKMTSLVWNVSDDYNINTIPESLLFNLPLVPTILNNSAFETTIIDGSLPSGIVLLNNSLVGTPNPITESTTSTFTIQATHPSGIVSNKTFTLTVIISPWTIETGYDINKAISSNAPIHEREDLIYNLPLINSPQTTTSVISGMLPPGLVLIDNILQGKPFEVIDTTTFTFVIRAILKNVVSDKTFYLTIEGPDVPEWITNPGLLPIGPSDRFYVRDESYVDFQLTSIDTDTIAGQSLQYWIASNDGYLPPGLTLTSTGRIFGWIEPLLVQSTPGVTGFYDTTPYDSIVYDRGTINSYGYDSYVYDLVKYDFTQYYNRPKKLNRNYEFIVSLSDGNTVTKRKFSILVVGDTSLVLNAALLGTVNDVTYDMPPVRDPVWFTPSDLGYKRANNYQTIKLDIYETIDKAPVIYSMEFTNPDGSASLLPPGLEFDSNTSEVFGVIPYQPAVTREYKFTITATRIGPLKAVSTSSEEKYPLQINDDIVYRRYDLEQSTGYNRVYQSSDFDSIGGIRMYRITSTSSWIYQNNNFDFLQYSQLSIPFVWDAKIWYNTDQLLVVVTAPMITVLPSGPTLFTDYYESSSTSRTFQLKVIGEIDRSIHWLSNAELGIIEAEQLCNLQIQAECSDLATINYSLVEGNLPPGLNLNSDGEIIGKVTQFNSFRFIGGVKGGLEHNPTDVRPPVRYTRVVGSVFDGHQIHTSGDYIWNSDSSLTPIVYEVTTISGGVDEAHATNLQSLGLVANRYYKIILSGWFNDGGTLKLYGSVNDLLFWNGTAGKVHYFIDVVGTSDPLLEPLDVSNFHDMLPGDFYDITVSGWFFDGLDLFYGNTDYSIVITALDKVQKIKTSSIVDRLTTFDFTIDEGTTTIDRVFGFDVLASDEALSKQIIQKFFIKVTTPNDRKFSDLIVQPMLIPTSREIFKNFITNMEIFDTKLLYRPGDPNYGIQNTLSMLIYAGIETTKTSKVISAVGQNHKRKKFKFGDLKIAQAKTPGTHNVVYEVIYIEMLDPLEVDGKSLPLIVETAAENSPITIDNNSSFTLDINSLNIIDPYQSLKQASTITNWRKRINDIGLHDRHHLPLWMRTIQDNTKVELDYVPAVTLCYCVPGAASTIMLNIQNYIKTTGFNFNQISYDIDRYIISTVTEYDHAKYIMFNPDTNNTTRIIIS